MKNNWLMEYRKNITSQAGEDGIIEKIFEILNIDKGWCVDVGAYGMSKSNTYSLIAKGWNGILIDMIVGVNRLKRIYKGFNNVNIVCAKVDLDFNNLDRILKESDCPSNIDLLSIDIDGNDYYIWKSLKYYTPTIVIMEFNPVMGLDEYIQPVDGNGGTSLTSIYNLGKELGYELIATTTLNAFFVKRGLLNKFNINNNSPEEFFIPGNYSYGRDETNYAKT